MANQFLVSVANAILRDATTGDAIAYGTTNINSSFALTTAQTDVRGGINNALLYTYIHDRQLEVKIEQATFDKNILALNAGQLVTNSSYNVTQTDCIVLSSSGSGVITETPVGDVTVFLPNGTVSTVTPSTKDITVPLGANLTVTAVYITTATADQITIETTTPPTVVDLTLIAEVRDNTGVIVEELQISVPRFQVLGNYTLSLAANGVSNQALEGRALSVASSDCVSGDYYAKVTWVPASGTAIPISSIAAIPSTLTFSAASLPATRQISVLGVRNGMYANADVIANCAFAASGSSGSSITVNSTTGLVTCGSTAASGNTRLITVTYWTATTGSILDYVTANVTA